jgi:hypothetical protein
VYPEKMFLKDCFYETIVLLFYRLIFYYFQFYFYYLLTSYITLETNFNFFLSQKLLNRYFHQGWLQFVLAGLMFSIQFESKNLRNFVFGYFNISWLIFWNGSQLFNYYYFNLIAVHGNLFIFCFIKKVFGICSIWTEGPGN